MDYQLNGQEQCEFEEVAVYFSEEEWDCLNYEEKELYRDVMMENYQTLSSLGQITLMPLIISLMERGEQPCVRSHRQTKETENPIITDPVESLNRRSSARHHRNPLIKHVKKSHRICEESLISSNSYMSTPPIITVEEKHFLYSEWEKYFPIKYCLFINQRTHTGDKFPCTEYGKCFNSKKNVGSHRRTHKEVKKLSCSECGKCFQRKSNLATHQKTHTGEKPFSCSECGKCFKSKSNLVSHEGIHTGEKKFLCSECGKSFQRKSNLATHQKTHTGEKPFSCSECEKRFNSKSNLVSHQRTHTGERNFLCSECGKCFQKKSNLVRHHSIHTGVKPFPCSECGKRLSSKSKLVRHQITHTGEKPFSCSECGKCYSSKSALGNHQLIHKRKNLLVF